MSAAVQVQQLSPVEEFVSNVLPPDRLDDLARSLPAHIKPQMFQRNLLNAIMINPDLMKHGAGLVFREVSKAAALGLYLDPQLGEAYIIEAYNYKTRSTEPQLRIGYLGMVKLAKQSGEIKQVYAHEVHEKDFIEAEQGAEKTLVHKPKLFTDRGPIIGYYSVVKFTNGDFDYEPMDVAQIHAIRDRTDGWKAYQDKKIKTTPWATDESEMAKKTVIRRLTKRMPKSPELAAAIKIEDEAEFHEITRPAAPRLVPPTPPVPTVASGKPAIEHQPQEAKEQRETATPPVPPKPAEAAREPVKKSYPLLTEKLRAACETAVLQKDIDALERAWDDIVAVHITSISRDQYEELKAIYAEAEGAFEP
jgi:recombination protein RecT